MSLNFILIFNVMRKTTEKYLISDRKIFTMFCNEKLIFIIFSTSIFNLFRVLF